MPLAAAASALSWLGPYLAELARGNIERAIELGEDGLVRLERALHGQQRCHLLDEIAVRTFEEALPDAAVDLRPGARW